MRRFTLTLALVAAIIAAAFAGTAHAYVQGDRYVANSNSHWDWSFSNIRAIRATVAYSVNDPAAGWTTGASNFVYGTVDAENGTSLFQIGYAIMGDLTTLDNCGANNNHVGIAVEWLQSNGYRCVWYNPPGGISPGDVHTFEVARCNNSNSDWCGYVDGTQIGLPHTIPMPTASYAFDGMEQYSDGAKLDADQMTTRSDIHPFAISEGGAGSETWHRIDSNESCTYNTGNGDFTIGNMGTAGTSSWSITQGNGVPVGLCS